MSIQLTKPLKFECTDCDKIYLNGFTQEEHHYPNCPHCQKAGLLLGTAEVQDLVRYPLDYATSYFKQTLHMLSKAH
ncbi:hypothetical protein A3K93_05430 [Acinetobacter sp. NCu2D-2]|uniref:hypothetical protein n=1 Tax=Acinetobacter sp. NCu2D-2 TaxID=1608473 RepID=UPI0007CDE01B|nr:hypothetical protein [Acinetobacter sp. NCu2D-2]ANF81678.1 hypothetical protein A3K93_05430 [Acinetobacter sp. NCu2D-2]